MICVAEEIRQVGSENLVHCICRMESVDPDTGVTTAIANGVFETVFCRVVEDHGPQSMSIVNGCRYTGMSSREITDVVG